MTDSVVVLGWDALDYQLLDEFDYNDDHVHRIATFDNPHAGEPLTRELWPSIITGVPPDEHGIHAATDSDGIDWHHPLLNTASSLASGLVPQSVRTKIGRWLRNRGSKLKQHPAEYLDTHPCGTVFDDRDAMPLSIPGYQTQRDRALGITVDRTAIWNGVLHTVETDDGTRYEPLVGREELEQRLLGKANKRAGYVEASIDAGHDIVFCWFGYLDTVGHLAPAVGGQRWQQRHYDRAIEWTRSLSRRDDTTVVCVSDHGLRDGTHTHDATYAGPPDAPVPESVLDVRDTLEAITPTNNRRTPDDMDAEALDGVDAQLEALGYT